MSEGKRNPRLPDRPRDRSSRIQEIEERKKKETSSSISCTVGNRAVPAGRSRKEKFDSAEAERSDLSVAPAQISVQSPLIGVVAPGVQPVQPTNDPLQLQQAPLAQLNLQPPNLPPPPQLPINMAAHPQIKFKTPPTFRGAPTEDAVEWLNRYETIGRYNRWGNDEFLANFPMYVEDAARQWQMCLPLQVTWTDRLFVAAHVANGVNIAEVPAAIGLRTTFLEEFQPGNYTVFQDAKLHNRVQGLDEDTTAYYYDVLNICRLVNPAMTEEQKLEHLYRGLKPSILEKVFPESPANSADFLAAIKRHALAAQMANRRNWSISVLTGEKKPEVIPAKEVAPSKDFKDLIKVINMLQEKVEDTSMAVRKIGLEKNVPNQTNDACLVKSGICHG